MLLASMHLVNCDTVPGPATLPHHDGDDGRAKDGALVRRLVGLAAVALAVLLLGRNLATLDVQALRQAWAATPWPTLLAAVALSVLSYGVYCGFDLLGRRYSGHGLATWQVLVAGFISHAGALNAGVAGAGLRFRSYGRLGVPAGQVARLWLVCLVGNWLGLLLLAGLLLTAGAMAGVLGARTGPWLGLPMLATVLAYLLACGWARRRSVQWRGHGVRLPSLPFALAQAAVSVLHWLSIAVVLQLLLGRALPFVAVLAALLLSALALAVVDVPAGLGVTEAVFIAALGGQLPLATLLAALLAWRLVYFLIPLGLAGLLHAALEVHGRCVRQRTA